MRRRQSRRVPESSAAGVAGKKQGDRLTGQDKARLRDYLRKKHGASGDGKKRITLKSSSTFKSDFAIIWLSVLRERDSPPCAGR